MKVPSRARTKPWLPFKSRRARDSALRADSITVSALEEAMGSAWGVERNDGCLPLVAGGKDKPRCDQANPERQQERRAGRHTL